jgi:eukaryotic-like serine/threonine-protein kinase
VTASVGTLLSGRYRVEARIGTGGMSSVYRAFDTVLERQVAIKQLHRDHAADAGQIERFRREARAVAQLNHPHVVGVIDVGSDGGSPYIVFEYVEGETLKDRIRRQGRLEVPEAVAYAIEITRALGAAHDRGIVHRDVKPQNVLIDEEGSAKVTDFGIARTLGLEGLTAEGRVLGTTDYVSPEQALGHQVTGQSDIYSLGVVLFEMLTGRVPFSGENQVSVAMKHVREEMPDVQALRPEVSSTLAAVIDRATAKDLRRRHASARELIADLEESLTVEASRRGQATGEATAVLRTLSERARSRLPLALRHPRRLVAMVAVAVAAAAAGLVVLANRAERGTGAGQVGTPSGLHNVSLGQNRAHDYDPLGDGEEHPGEVKAVLDRQPSTFWATERYDGGVITKGGSTTGTGVGVYVDAAPRAAAEQIGIVSASPGWSGKIYGATSGPPATLPAPGWHELATVTNAKGTERLALNTGGQSFRYYLIWITGLPPGEDRVRISEVFLFERR